MRMPISQRTKKNNGKLFNIYFNANSHEYMPVKKQDGRKNNGAKKGEKRVNVGRPKDKDLKYGEKTETVAIRVPKSKVPIFKKKAKAILSKWIKVKDKTSKKK